jgi:predicted MFS family arabinose efflux permease
MNRSFATVAFAFVVAMLGTTMPSALYPIYSAEWGWSRLTTTVVFATYAVGVLASLVLLGDLSDRIGRKRVLVPGLVAAALSAVCFLLADGLTLVLVGRLLSGLCAGIFTGTATATLVELVPEDERPRASVLATIANMGGLGLGPVFAGVVADVLPDPLRTPYLLHLALVLVAGALLAGVPEPKPATGSFAIRPRGLTVPAAVRGVFVSAGVAGFAGFAMMGLSNAVFPGFLTSIGVSDHAVVGLAVFALFAGSILGQLLRRRVPDVVAMAGGCAVLVVGALLVILGVHVESFALMVVATLVAGTGQGLSFAAGVALVAVGSPADQRAAVTSSLFVVMYVAISVPVVGVGLLANAVGLVPAATVFSVVVAVLAAVAGALLLRRRADG